MCSRFFLQHKSARACTVVGGIMDKMIGKRSVQFEVPPCIIGAASVAGEKRGSRKIWKIL